MDTLVYTSAQWRSTSLLNKIIQAGVLCAEIENDYKVKLKIGNGKDRWVDLPYIPELSGYYTKEEIDSFNVVINNKISELEADKHTHDNKEILDKITKEFTIEDKEKLDSITPYDDKEVNKRLTNLEKDSHTHKNKSLLDQTTAVFTTEYEYIITHMETYDVFVGATATKPGTEGLVPAPKAGDNEKFLRGDGNWVTVEGGGTYVLPPATRSTLGGVKIGDNINVDANGVISVTFPPIPEPPEPYVLPIASASTLGGIKVGDGLSIDGTGTLSATGTGAIPPATTTTIGGVIVGDGISVENDGTISVTQYQAGVATEIISGGTAETGKAITALSYNTSTGVISVTKGTFLTQHPTITTDTDTTSTASPSHGGTFTAIDSVTRDTNGHVKKVNTKTVTLPAQYSHPTYTAYTGKPTANQTPAFGATFTISQVKSDATGHVTSMTDRTVKIPALTYTATVTSSTTDAYQIGTLNIGGTDNIIYGKNTVYSHPTYTRSNTTSSASPAHGGTFTVIDSITSNTLGHVTAVNTKTITLPADSNTDTKVTQTNTTDNAAYRVLLSGSANDTTETTTSRKSTRLQFYPTNGVLNVNSSSNYPIRIDYTPSTNLAAGALMHPFRIAYKNTDGTATHYAYPISVIGNDATGDNATNNYGIRLGSTNGTTIVGAGESPFTFAAEKGKYNDENLYLVADGSVLLYRGMSNDSTTGSGPWTVGGFTTTPTSGQVMIADGTVGGYKTSGYTIAKSVPSNAVFTDTNTYVTQSASTTTNYRPLILGATNTTTVADLAATVTGQTYATTKIYAQPSTGNLYANTFVGKLYRAKGGSWINARDNAVAINDFSSTGESFAPIGFAKSSAGGWAIGTLSNRNKLYLSYTTDANYSSGTNTSTYTIEFPEASGTVALTNHTHDSLTTKTLTATTLENTAGNFFFGGSALLGGINDWVGIQADAGNDKFQLIAQGGLIFRQNDSGGTNSTNWTDWVNLLTPGTISGTNGITATITTSTLGSGTSALTYNSGVQIGHSNSVTAVTTAGMLKVKYDAQGHITGSSAFASADVSALLNLLGTGSSTPKDADYYISQYANGGTTTTTYHRRPVSALWTYMKGKADSVYAPLSHTHAASDITSGALPIAHGGTGATTRLNALKALTDENVGTSAQYFLTITQKWGKGGYTTVANAKTVLGLGSAAYTSSTDYATAGHTHSNYLGAVNANGYYGMAKPDGTATDWIRTTNKGLIPYESGGAGSGHQSLGTSSWYFANAYIDTVHGSLSGNASTASELKTARSIALGSDFQGSALFDGSANITINGNHYYVDVNGGNKANYPWHRIATTSGRSGNYVDVDALLLIRAEYNGGSFGILKISLRTNGSGNACDISARWIVRYGFDAADVVIAEWGNTGDDVYADVFLKCGTYPRIDVVQLLGYRSWTLVTSNEVNNTTTSDKLTSTEVYVSVASAATEIHGKAYTKTANGISAGRVSVADTADKLNTNAGNVNRPVYFSNGVPVICNLPESGSWKNAVPAIGADGLMEVGKYIDFHESVTSTNDYDVRMNCDSTDKGTMIFTSKTGNTEIKISGTLPRLRFQQTTSGKAYDDDNVGITVRPANTSGTNMFIQSNGNMVIGAGEYPINFHNATKSGASTYPDYWSDGGEQMYVGSDSNVIIHTNANTIGNRKGFMFTTAGNLQLAEGGGIVFKYATSDVEHKLVSAGTTTARTWTLPNATGTICLTSHNHDSTYLGINANAVSATDATNSANVYVTLTNPSSSTTYYLPFISNVSSGNKGLKGNNGITYSVKEGTTSATGVVLLALGNIIGSGTAGNKSGSLRMYGTSTGYTNLNVANTTATNYTATLPNATGRVGIYKDLYTSTAAPTTTSETINLNSSKTIIGVYDILKVWIYINSVNNIRQIDLCTTTAAMAQGPYYFTGVGTLNQKMIYLNSNGYSLQLATAGTADSAKISIAKVIGIKFS